MSLGTDFELFCENENQSMAIPALSVYKQYGTGFQPIHKRIPNDRVMGFDSLIKKVGPATLIEDGLAVEITTEPGDAQELLHNIKVGIEAATEIATSADLTLTTKPLIHFDIKWLDTQEELRVLGCDPDMSIFFEDVCRPSQNPLEVNFRTCGGHIHFSPAGFDKEDPSRVESMVLLCDAVLGLADALLDPSELARDRKTMYGQPGKYRLPPHGLEYRTPSSVWVSNPELALDFLTLAQAVHDIIEVNPLEGYYLPHLPMEVAEAIMIGTDAKTIFEATLDHLGLHTNIHERNTLNYQVRWVL